MALAVLLALPVATGCGPGDTADSPSTARAPQRIVSLSPTATEDLYAIGAGNLIAAVDGESDYPPAAPRTELSGFQPNVEAVAAYRPDLVVVSAEGTEAAVRGLRKLGIDVLVQAAATSLAEVYAQLRELGRIVDRQAEARAAAARIRARVARAVQAAPSGLGLSVYHEVSPDYFSADSSTFIGRIYRLFGLANIADGAGTAAGTGYPQLSAEHILEADPDLIVITDTECCNQSPATVRRRPGWSGIAAIRHGDVIAIEEDVASRWGPRVAEFAERLGEALDAVRGTPNG
ncbi:MAG TPA: helical backbone metal receptor [Solirubrobacterales bacterium]|nr:helical backbone metal receptor [Solirubrobacterales bacterium]